MNGHSRSASVRAWFEPCGPDAFSADVTLAPGVVLELVSGESEDSEWEVWGIRIDGVLYKESRDLTGEPLRGDGEFRQWLLAEAARWRLHWPEPAETESPLNAAEGGAW